MDLDWWCRCVSDGKGSSGADGSCGADGIWCPRADVPAMPFETISSFQVYQLHLQTVPVRPVHAVLFHSTARFSALSPSSSPRRPAHRAPCGLRSNRGRQRPRGAGKGEDSVAWTRRPPSRVDRDATACRVCGVRRDSGSPSENSLTGVEWLCEEVEWKGGPGKKERVDFHGWRPGGRCLFQ